MSISKNNIYHGDCLELMENIETGSIDMILTDLPYGVTKNPWDVVIDIDKMWTQYNRVIKDSGAILLTATQPFATRLIMGNINNFRYELIWEKNNSTGFLNAGHRPLQKHELVLVFYKKLGTYNPQKKYKSIKKINKQGTHSSNYGALKDSVPLDPDSYFPTSLINFGYDNKKLHPTQKPINLFSYLIKTYTNDGDIVLDTCAGSATTGRACQNTGRNFILMEKDLSYYQMAKKRLKEENPVKENGYFEI